MLYVYGRERGAIGVAYWMELPEDYDDSKYEVWRVCREKPENWNLIKYVQTLHGR